MRTSRARIKRLTVLARYFLLLVGVLASVTFIHQVIYVEHHHHHHDLQAKATQVTRGTSAERKGSSEKKVNTEGGDPVHNQESGRYLDLGGGGVEVAHEGGSSGRRNGYRDGGEKYVVITSAPGAASNDSHPVFSFRTTVRNCRVRAKLDNATSFAGVSNNKYRVKERLHEGWHTLQLACRRYPHHPTVFSWRIDFTPPKVRLLRASSRITKDSTGFMVLESNEKDCTFESHLDYKSKEGEPWRNALLKSTRHAKFKPVSLTRRRLTKHEVKILLDGLVEGTYRYTVYGTDAAGNRGSPTHFDFIVDKTPPVTKILKTPKLIDTSRNASFLLECPSEDSTSDYTIGYKLDDLEWQPVHESPLDEAYEIRIDGLVDGPHHILFRAKDTAGNVEDPPISFEWVSQISSTQTQIISGPARRSSRASETFSVTSSESKFGYSYVLDGGSTVWPEGRLKLVSGIRNFTVMPLKEGSHRIAISSVDVSGLEDQTPATYEWETDLTHPECRFDRAPDTVTASQEAFFRITCDEDYSLAYSLDASAWDPDSSLLNKTSVGGSSVNLSFSDLDEGKHTLKVCSTDSVGNAGIYKFDWVVDAGKRPVVMYLVTPMKQSKSKKSEFKVACSKRSCTYQMRLDQSGSWKNLSNKKNKKAYEIKELGEVGGQASVVELAVSTSAGFHTMELSATDASGKRGEVKSYEWVVF